jgi:ABC-type nitrate/sulfonate/bicarbonate transport system substrate-binding protein
VEQTEIGGKGRVLPGSGALINSVMSMAEPFLRSEPTAAGAIVGSIQKAKVWMVDHPDEAQAIAAKELGLDLAVVQRAWPRFNWRASLTDGDMAADFQAKADFLARSGELRNDETVDVQKQLINTAVTVKASR